MSGRHLPLRSCAGVALTLFVAPLAAAALRVTTASLKLHERPSASSAAIATIPRGTTVDASKCGRSWCSVTWHDATGWVPASRLEAPHAGKHGHGYRNVDGDWVPSPQDSPSPPAGATAQCNDGKYSFSKHRRGTCSHHGGVKRWL